VLESLLVANRGEIARRIIRTAQRLDVKAVAVYSEADADLPYVAAADEAVPIGAAAPAESYLDHARLLEAVRQTGVEAVHPGYGFLAEDPDFAQAVIDAGVTWVGPQPSTMIAMADKINARNLMADAGVPVLRGTRQPVLDGRAAARAAAEIGYPVMVKAAGGGGGIGMGVAADEAALLRAYDTARTRAERFFGNPAILLESYLPHARHVEVQILGLGDGRVVALGERDCSVQRRHQKVAEESPSPGISAGLRAAMLDAAVQAGTAVGYRGAGTVECLVDVVTGDFVFLEMNTRLQVEHPVTELVTGIDLVEQQLLIASEEPVSFAPESSPARGHALELRVYAEDPRRFLPGPGRISHWREPAGEGVRVDAGYAEGNTVTPYYDPLLAKLCIWGEDRPQCLARARQAVGEFEIVGPKHNLPFFLELLEDPGFAAGDYDTGIIEGMRPGLRPGMQR